MSKEPPTGNSDAHSGGDPGFRAVRHCRVPPTGPVWKIASSRPPPRWQRLRPRGADTATLCRHPGSLHASMSAHGRNGLPCQILSSAWGVVLMATSYGRWIKATKTTPGTKPCNTSRQTQLCGLRRAGICLGGPRLATTMPGSGRTSKAREEGKKTTGVAHSGARPAVQDPKADTGHWRCGAKTVGARRPQRPPDKEDKRNGNGD